ncbi:hypothetical protein D3C78_1056760 [compost metagenome]
MVEQVEFQPEALGGRNIQQAELTQHAVQPLQGEQQRAASQLAVFAGGQLQGLAGGQLGGARQLLLQGLAEGGDLLAAGIEDHHLVAQVAFQLRAGELHFRLQQLEQLQAIGWRGLQTVEFLQGGIQAAGGFTEVGLGQLGQPGADGSRLRGGKAQRGHIRWRDAQQGVGGVQIHGGWSEGRWSVDLGRSGRGQPAQPRRKKFYLNADPAAGGGSQWGPRSGLR